MVRGRFTGLDDDSAAGLRECLAEHEALNARFTADGTLVYDARLDFFCFRYEIRARSEDGADPTGAAFADAVARAERYLSDRGLGHRGLKPSGSDLTRVWEDD